MKHTLTYLLKATQHLGFPRVLLLSKNSSTLETIYNFFAELATRLL